MANKPGLRTISFVSNTAGVNGDQAFTSNTTLASVGLLKSIGANEKVHMRFWIPITVGAAGGVKLQVIAPTGMTAYNQTVKLFDTVAPALTTASSVATTPAAFNNALANAGTHWLEVEITAINGATAGSLDLQMAQNSSNATPLTVLRGGFAYCDTF